MSPRTSADKIAETATKVIATQLDRVMMSGPDGIAVAFRMLAAMVAAVADRAKDPLAAYGYFRRIVETAETVGVEMTRRLDAGEIEIDDLAKMAKPEGEA